ncbi:MAG: hypothetical protein JZU50_04525 [Desulfobulbaceae bacterium]|nr:hypothetical protein [Desulfobulbaceae bacterium]
MKNIFLRISGLKDERQLFFLQFFKRLGILKAIINGHEVFTGRPGAEEPAAQSATASLPGAPVLVAYLFGR